MELPIASLLTTLLFEQTDEGMGIWNPELQQFQQTNALWERWFGKAGDTHLLTGIPELTNPEALGVLIQGNPVPEREIQLTKQDGEVFWAKVRLMPLDHLVLIRVSNQDWLYRIQDQLEQNARRYEAVFENATVGILVSDRQGTIISCNQLGYRLFGYEKLDLIGKSIDILVPKTIEAKHERYRDSFFAHPQVRSMGHNRDLYAQRKDGSVFPVEISLSYFQLDQQLYAVAYIIDITFKKQVEEELLEQKTRIQRLNTDLEQKIVDRTHALMTTLAQLEESKDELSKALAAERELGELKSRFVSMASHEFRTPLTTVLTSASLIEKYTETTQQEARLRHVRRIYSSVNHLNDILEEFLSVGRLEEGKVQIRTTEEHLPTLLNDIRLDLKGLMKPGQQIETIAHCDQPVVTDASLLRKIMVNLTSNAIKYSGENSTIVIQADCRNNEIEISIKDQGIGISEEDQKHLFERFFRAKNVTNIQGTGLGLHIVMKYLEILGGTIKLESVLEEGTTVTIRIPSTNQSSL